MTHRKLTRRESLQLASSAVALGAGLGVGLTTGKVSAASPQVSFKWEFRVDGITEPLATFQLPEKVLSVLKQRGAGALTVRVVGEGEKGTTPLGGFKLPSALQHKFDTHLGR